MIDAPRPRRSAPPRSIARVDLTARGSAIRLDDGAVLANARVVSLQPSPHDPGVVMVTFTATFGVPDDDDEPR